MFKLVQILVIYNSVRVIFQFFHIVRNFIVQYQAYIRFVFSEVWPKVLLTDAIGTPLERVTLVAKV